MRENMAKDLQYYVMFPCEVDISIDQEKTLKSITQFLYSYVVFFHLGVQTDMTEV